MSTVHNITQYLKCFLNLPTASTSPNPYVTRKLNNINEAKLFKKEYEDWIKLYHKTLKGLKAIIDVQRQV